MEDEITTYCSRVSCDKRRQLLDLENEHPKHKGIADIHCEKYGDRNLKRPEECAYFKAIRAIKLLGDSSTSLGEILQTRLESNMRNSLWR